MRCAHLYDTCIHRPLTQGDNVTKNPIVTAGTAIELVQSVYATLADRVAAGRALFESRGCKECHEPKPPGTSIYEVRMEALTLLLPLRLSEAAAVGRGVAKVVAAMSAARLPIPR